MQPRFDYPIQSNAADAMHRTDLLVGRKATAPVEFKDIEPAKAGTPEEVGSVQAARTQVKRLIAEGTPLNTMCASLGSLAKLLRRLEDLGPEWGDEPAPAPSLVNQIHDEVSIELPEDPQEAASLLEPVLQRIYTMSDQPPLMESLLRARKGEQA